MNIKPQRFYRSGLLCVCEYFIAVFRSLPAELGIWPLHFKSKGISFFNHHEIASLMGGIRLV